MKAWRVHRLGEPVEVLAADDVPRPEPGPGQLLVAVAACGVNFPDLLLCSGRYQERPPLPFTPGLELAGAVVAAGPGATKQPGERVVGTPVWPYGGMAEYALISAEAAYPVPDGQSDVDAAAMHITYQTAYVGLHRRARLLPGETVLVHAGAGGVGSAAIQVALAAGARVLATARGESKLDACRQLGATQAYDYTTTDVVAAVRDATDGRGADVVWDPVGGEVFAASTRCVAFEGRLVVVGFAGGTIPQVPAGHVLVKNYSVVGVHWGLYGRVDPQVPTWAHGELTRLYAAGAIRPLIADVLPLDQAPEALRRLAAREVLGKLVLAP